MQLDLLRRAGQKLADHGPDRRIGTIDILSLDGVCILWPDSAQDIHSPEIIICKASLEDAVLTACDMTKTTYALPSSRFADHDDCLSAACDHIATKLGLDDWQVTARWDDERQRDYILVDVTGLDNLQ